MWTRSFTPWSNDKTSLAFGENINAASNLEIVWFVVATDGKTLIARHTGPTFNFRDWPAGGGPVHVQVQVLIDYHPVRSLTTNTLVHVRPVVATPVQRVPGAQASDPLPRGWYVFRITFDPRTAMAIPDWQQVMGRQYCASVKERRRGSLPHTQTMVIYFPGDPNNPIEARGYWQGGNVLVIQNWFVRQNPTDKGSAQLRLSGHGQLNGRWKNEYRDWEGTWRFSGPLTLDQCLARIK